MDYLRKGACSQGSEPPPAGWPCARYVADPIMNPGKTSYFEDQGPGTVVFGVHQEGRWRIAANADVGAQGELRAWGPQVTRIERDGEIRAVRSAQAASLLGPVSISVSPTSGSATA